MDTIVYLLTGACKIMLLLVGLVMLFGGGICVVMDIGIFSSNPDSDAFLIIGIAGVVTFVGWKLTQSALSTVKSSSKNNHTTHLNDWED